jgi:hypothetical protein
LTGLKTYLIPLLKISLDFESYYIYISYINIITFYKGINRMDEAKKNQFNKSVSFGSQEALDEVNEYVKKLKVTDHKVTFSKFVRQCIQEKIGK